MPRPRPRRPPRRSPELQALWDLRERQNAWNAAVSAETWRLVYAEGGRCCGSAEFRRGQESLIARGVRPPPGAELI